MSSRARKRIHWIFPILIISKFSFAQTEFPLTGQTWVFVNGATEESHVVRSISDFSPSKVIVASFLSTNKALVRFANLSGVYCRSTAEALDSINEQLFKNPAITVAPSSTLRAFPDTAYSCDEEILKLSHGSHFTKFVINNLEVSPTATVTDWHWSFNEPVCYASRPAIAQDKEDKDLCQDGWCSDPTPSPTDPYQEACNDTYTECRHYVDESLLKT